MAANKRRQDERHLKILRELGAQPANKRCFDCQQRGPTYVDMTTGAFVCTSCSGILRGLNPPHRVKSISMTSFTPEEIEFIKRKGNEYCRHVWLGTYDARLMPENESNDEQRVKDFLIQKYERKRWYVDPAVVFKNQPSSVPNSTLSPTFTTSESKSLASFPSNSVKQVTTTPPSHPVGNTSKSAESSSLANSTLQKPPARPSLDLLSGFAGDPFASTGQPAPISANANFADFDNFNSAGAATPPSVGTTPMSIASSSSSQMSGTVPSPGSVATTLPGSGSALQQQQSSSATSAPAQDKYAALADLDNLFNTSNANTNVEWEGGKNGSSQWQMNGMSPLAYASTGNTPTNPCNTGFASGSSNPFSVNSQQNSWTPTQQQSPSSFCGGNPFAMGGFGSQPTPSGAFSQFGSSPVTPPSSYITYPPTNGQMNPLTSPPGNVSSWGGANMGSGWVNFGAPPQPSSVAFPSQTGAYQGNKMMGMPYNSWHQPNVGNPFVGGGAPVHPSSNSSNPFL